MEDHRIIELYWQRNESAIQESQSKYGAYCAAIAGSILHAAEDAEDCVNDTWLRAWNAMPPERPGRLAVFFGLFVADSGWLLGVIGSEEGFPTSRKDCSVIAIGHLQYHGLFQ